MAKAKRNEKKSAKKADKRFDADCNRIRTALRRIERNDVPARYKVAVMVKNAMAKALYGEKKVFKMEDAIGLDRKTLYRMARVAKAWTATAFNKIASRTTGKKMPLSWCHFELLAKVKDIKNRDSLVERAFNNSMTILELKDAINGRTGQKLAKPTEGASPVSNDEPQVAENLYQWVNEFEAEIEIWGNKLKDDVQKELDEGGAAKLNETVERMARAAKTMQVMADELKSMLISVLPAMGQLHELKPATAMATTAAM